MPSPFHAYDIRGVYPTEVNPDLIDKVIPVLSKKFFSPGDIVVGRDGRLGSEELAEAVLKALNRENRVSINAGLITTPMLTFLVHGLDVGGGIMVTASHNPKEYNGLKILDRDGEIISGTEISEAM